MPPKIATVPNLVARRRPTPASTSSPDCTKYNYSNQRRAARSALQNSFLDFWGSGRLGVTVGVSADTPAATMEDGCRDAGRRLADLLARLYERCSQGGEAGLLYWPGGLAAAQRPPSSSAPSPGSASHQSGDPVEARGEWQAPRTLGEIQLRAGRLPRRALSEWVSLKAFVPVAIVDAEGFQQLLLSGLVG